MKTTSPLEQFLYEETLRQILSDREVQIQETNYNWDWTGYSVRYRTVKVMSELISWVTKYLLESQKSFIEKMKIDFEKIFNEEILKQFTRKSITEEVQRKFKHMISIWFNRDIESKINSDLRDELRPNYTEWRNEKFEYKIKRLAKEQWEIDANNYIEANKEKIMSQISENSIIKVEVIQKETITWTTTVSNK